MPDSNFSEESFFFLHIDSVCRTPAPVCYPETNIVEAARSMREQNLTGLIVTENSRPVGIISVRDLRDLIASGENNLNSVMARDVMHAGVITIRHRAYVFEAIFKMAKHNIHRLAVINEEQELIGVINDTDLLSLQTRSPLYLTQEMEVTETLDGLREINGRILDMVRCATGSGADIRSLIQLIAHFNDTLTRRIIEILDCSEGIRLPGAASYLALGSEGRGEQTLRTDQDSAMVYSDDISGKDLETAHRFANRLVAALEYVGVPRCPGNTMASNPDWCHSLSEWKQRLEQWITVPTGQNMVNFGMFQDFRTIHGDPSLEEDIHAYILTATRRNNLFFPYVAKNIVRFPPPLGMFGRIKVDRRGPDRGKVNLKKAGIFAITEGISLLALEQNIHHGTTWEKIDQLVKLSVLSAKDGAMLSESFTQLVNFRLNRQLSDIAAGHSPGNSIDPMMLPEKSREQLREALRGVNQLLRIIRDHYRLDFISR